MSTRGLSIAAIIPTKNRAADLGRAVESIAGQTRRPDQLIIVDQSAGDDSRRIVHEQLSLLNADWRLDYIHDQSIAGLVDAKRVGSERADADLVCFLEDDVVLEPGYFAAIQRGFERTPSMIGCSGVMTNPPRTSRLYVHAHRWFFRGIFDDPRVTVTAAALEGESDLVRCRILSGGLSCWRREVFRQVQFDVKNGFFMFEDMEFATRVARAMGDDLYINPAARLAHYGSPVNRDTHGARQRRKSAEAVVFYRTRRAWQGAKSGLAFALTWWLGEAFVQSVRNGTPQPLVGFVRGIWDGARRPVRPA